MNVLFKSRIEKSLGNVNITIELLRMESFRLFTCHPDGIHIAYNHHLVAVQCLKNPH